MRQPSCISDGTVTALCLWNPDPGPRPPQAPGTQNTRIIKLSLEVQLDNGTTALRAAAVARATGWRCPFHYVVGRFKPLAPWDYGCVVRGPSGFELNASERDGAGR